MGSSVSLLVVDFPRHTVLTCLGIYSHSQVLSLECSTELGGGIAFFGRPHKLAFMNSFLVLDFPGDISSLESLLYPMQYSVLDFPSGLTMRPCLGARLPDALTAITFFWGLFWTGGHGVIGKVRKDDVGDEPRLLPLNASSLQTPEPGSQDEGSEWLGTYLLTPHYKTLVLAIKPPERTMRSALDLLQERSPDVPGTFFDTVLPLRPQRFAGIGSFVRFSSTVRNTGVGGQAVVVLDLTRVGGHYFVAVLAKELAFQALVEYIIPLTNGEEPPIEIYIGYRTRPWPASALVTLADGDVITVIRQHTPVSTPQKAEDLFADGTKWEYPQTIPRFTYGESLCVLHRDQRFLLPEHHHYGQSSVSYIAEKLRLDPHKTVMCSFAIKDLDVQGHLARSLVAVAEVPSPATTGTPREEAVDLFVLLDPRLSTSPACKVGVAGGVRRGDHVQVQGNTSLLLFPEQKTADELEEEASSSSSTSGIVSPWEDEAESHTEGHIEDDWGGPFGLTLQGVPTLDPSLPPGHSWNEGISDPEPTGPHPALPYPPEPVGPLGASPEVTTPPPAGGHVARLRIQALVYVPDYVPEIVEIETDLPTTVSAFTELLQDARLASQSSSFPDLFPVSSQSVPAFGVFVAAPQWQCDTAVVLFDCLAYDGTFFAKTVFCRLNRESLLLAAGVPPDAAVHVYLRSSLHHFNMDQRVVMQNGTLVQIARRGIVPGAGHDLADRLTTVDLWDRNAELPGPKTHYNGCFHILSEGRPFPFLVAPGRHATFKQDVAAVLGTVDHRLTIKSAAPRRIVDSYPFGYWATAVVVATEALSRVPCPPARQRETRRILVLDQRRILKGFAWRLVPGSIVPVQDVLDLYTNLCPFCHTVLAHGAPTEEVDGRMPGQQPVTWEGNGPFLLIGGLMKKFSSLRLALAKVQAWPIVFGEWRRNALEELRQVSSKKAGAALLALGLFAYSRQLLQEYLQLLRRWHPDKTADKAQHDGTGPNLVWRSSWDNVTLRLRTKLENLEVRSPAASLKRQACANLLRMRRALSRQLAQQFWSLG
ncbi:unnamed protein product [Symbiodinium microadriaticum]|nr:unnamed protein product [Symbiodinium microadriaticum]